MPEVEVSNAMTVFIDNAIWSLSIADTFQRGKIYRKGSSPSDSQKIAFKNKIKEIIKSQTADVGANESEGFVKKLKDSQELINGMIERDGYSSGINKFRFGTTQKLVNLYLKYQWCLGWRDEPPHCPFDGIILGEKLGLPDKWTKSDDVRDYLSWVKEAEKRASSEGKTIAQWELEAWNDWLENK